MSVDFSTGHKKMMEYLHGRDIKDPRVLAAMNRVQRHCFLPSSVRKQAYTLRPVSLGHGQTMSTPYIVASMTDLLGLSGEERVLEIGTGCGYQTAVLCELSKEVFSIEIVEPVGRFGRENLKNQGYEPHLRIGDGGYGWEEASPFNAILIAATAPHIPQALLDQLLVGGVLVAPVEHANREYMMRIKRTNEGFEREVLYGVRFVPMTGMVRSLD